MCFPWAQWNSFVRIAFRCAHTNYPLDSNFLSHVMSACHRPSLAKMSSFWSLKSLVPWNLNNWEVPFLIWAHSSHMWFMKLYRGFMRFKLWSLSFEAWDFIYHPTTRSPDLLPGGFAPQGGENMLCRSCAKLDISTWLFFKIRFG